MRAMISAARALTPPGARSAVHGDARDAGGGRGAAPDVGRRRAAPDAPRPARGAQQQGQHGAPRGERQADAARGAQPALHGAPPRGGKLAAQSLHPPTSASRAHGRRVPFRALSPALLAAWAAWWLTRACVQDRGSVGRRRTSEESAPEPPVSTREPRGHLRAQNWEPRAAPRETEADAAAPSASSMPGPASRGVTPPLQPAAEQQSATEHEASGSNKVRAARSPRLPRPSTLAPSTHSPPHLPAPARRMQLASPPSNRRAARWRRRPQTRRLGGAGGGTRAR